MDENEKLMEIHPQRCYQCSTELREGDQALASKNFPLAFCLKCRKKNGEFALAVVKGDRNA